MEITYDEFYKVMDIGGIIIIEDAIDYEFTRTAIFYDYIKLSKSEKELFEELIQEKHRLSQSFSLLRKLLYEKSYFINWEEVPARDVEYYLKKEEMKELLDIIESIMEEDLYEIEDEIYRFGLGVKNEIDMGYSPILEGARKIGVPLRIYRAYTADEKDNIKSDIIDFTKDNKYFLCIIDNFIDGERGEEIANDLSQIKEAIRFGVCILISSQTKAGDISIPEPMYIGYVQKGEENRDLLIKQELIKSQYKILMNNFREKRLETVDKVFSFTVNNMDIAIYLSSMAREEGATNYDVINDWIGLREKYYWEFDNKEVIKQMVLLSSMLGNLAREGDSITTISDQLIDFQIFEEYDYNVNSMHVPPLSGDIYYIKGSYYMLTGQECDLSLREDGRRKNPIAELLPIKVVTGKDMGRYKENYDTEKLLLGRFKNLDGNIVNISIDCTKRYLIDNEILDISTFNIDGKAVISFNDDLDVKIKNMLPVAWQTYYLTLSSNLCDLNDKLQIIQGQESTLGFSVSDLMKRLGAGYNNRLVSNCDYKVKDKILEYDVQRICRIKNHVLLANKLFLEYRGRQAFNTINMDNGRISQYILKQKNSDVKLSGKSMVVILTSRRNDNDLSKLKNRQWVIEKKDIKEFLELVDNERKKYSEEEFEKLDDFIILPDREGFFCNSIKYTKQSKDDILSLTLDL